LNPKSRTIAIGDIHGCWAALRAVLAAVDPRSPDTIVTLGDYVDRGPHSREAIDELIALNRRCHVVPILGNHDEMMLDICLGRRAYFGEWLLYGGDATLESYGGRVPGGVPSEHVAFLERCVRYYETDSHFFLHGSYLAELPLQDQPPEVLCWENLRQRVPGAHRSGKTAIVGHTAQKNGEILDLGYLKCIDTCCYGAGWLTALDVESGEVWQADKEGCLRQ